MEKVLSLIVVLFIGNSAVFSQENKRHSKVIVPAIVESAFHQKYANAKNVTWEKEKGNYEANWGGKSGEDTSVQFSPGGAFIEMVKAIPVSDLPKPVFVYVNEYFKGSKITEAGKVTDAKGKIYYEAEIKGKDVSFDENGNFVTSEE